MAENIGKYNIILEFLTQTEKGGTEKIKKEASGLEKTFNRAKAAFAGIFVAQTLKNAGQAVFDVAKKYQSYAKTLEVALGSEKASAQAMKLIQTTAKETIFSVDELTAAYIKFANRGVKLSKDEIIAFGDLAASQGKSFDQLTEAVLDSTQNSHERLKEFGVRASSNGNKVTFSFRGVTKEVQNTEQAIKQAILEFGKMDGVAGSNAKQMGTLSGLVSNLGDNFESFLKTIGEKASPAFSFVLKLINNAIDKVNEFITDNTGFWRNLENAVNPYIRSLQNLGKELLKLFNIDFDSKKMGDRLVEGLTPVFRILSDVIDGLTKIVSFFNSDKLKPIKDFYNFQINLLTSIPAVLNGAYSGLQQLGKNALVNLKNFSLNSQLLYEQSRKFFGAKNAEQIRDLKQQIKDNIADPKTFLQAFEDGYNAIKNRGKFRIASRYNSLVEGLVPDSGLPGSGKGSGKDNKSKASGKSYDPVETFLLFYNLLNPRSQIDARQLATDNEIITFFSELNGQIDDLFQERRINKESFEYLKFLTGAVLDPLGTGEKIAKDQKDEFKSLKIPLDYRNQEDDNSSRIFGFTKEQLAIFNETVDEAFKYYVDALNNLLQYESQVNQQRIALQEQRVDKARELAEQGKVDQLKIEEDRLAELQAKQRDYANAQKSISNLQITASTAVATANAIEGITNAFKIPGPAGIALGIAQGIALTAQIAALVTSIKSQFSNLQFKDGIERLNGPGTRRSDSIPVWLSRDERVVDAATNERMGFTFPNKELPKAVALYKMFPNLSKQISGSGQVRDNSKRVEAKLDNMTNILEGIHFDFKMDADGLAATLVKKKGNITYRKSLL